MQELSEHWLLTRQLAKIDPEILREELRGYGAWDDDELGDHAQNLQRLLWLAAGDLVDSPYEQAD